MGLMDRDYMHERSRKPAAWPPSARRLVLYKALAFVATFVAAQVYLNQKKPEVFPRTGSAIWFVPVPSQGLAPLKITAPRSGEPYHAVILRKPSTGQVVGIITLRLGEEATASAPLGRYEFLFASGSRWYGPKHLFGFFGEKKVSVGTFEFYRTSDGVYGHTIDMNKHFNGNLQTRSALPGE